MGRGGSSHGSVSLLGCLCKLAWTVMADECLLIRAARQRRRPPESRSSPCSHDTAGVFLEAGRSWRFQTGWLHLRPCWCEMTHMGERGVKAIFRLISGIFAYSVEGCGGVADIKCMNTVICATYFFVACNQKRQSLSQKCDVILVISNEGTLAHSYSASCRCL